MPTPLGIAKLQSYLKCAEVKRLQLGYCVDSVVGTCFFASFRMMHELENVHWASLYFMFLKLYFMFLDCCQTCPISQFVHRHATAYIDFCHILNAYNGLGPPCN
jgi:hypothetical protein